ncbi:hypothetical protein FH969_07050 [Miniimonas arenae]|uniref:Uncharacterized protein n=1 Tax=Miniimonas arenae TaxID=676201 RepID=A0A5C5BE71_9MICO|nr:hypothetical protein [Miniimonas arenae]TNU74867.1 hypothetical protein FH969_07050 [Miniimonas arenae]
MSENTRLHQAVASAANHETARAVLGRLDLGGPNAAFALLGALTRTVARRVTKADSAVVLRAGKVTLEDEIVDGEAERARDVDAEEAFLDVLAGPDGARVTAARVGADGTVHEVLAWDLLDGWLWPAHTDLDHATPGPEVWRVVLEDQREEQRRTNRALEVGSAILRTILSSLPEGESTLRVVDAGPDRTYTVLRDSAGAHIPATPASLQAEAALIGGPIAYGAGAVTLVLHTGEEHAGGAQLRSWRVGPERVEPLDAHETRSEFGPRWFDRHHGLEYVDAEPITVPGA